MPSAEGMTLPFLRDNGFMVAKKSGSETQFTHTLREMDRTFNLNIPVQLLQQFKQLYIDDIEGGKMMCIHENLSDSYNMFVDISVPLELEIKDVAKYMKECFEQFVEKDKGVLDDCIVCTAEEQDGKVQCRFIWPKFIVDTQAALTMRERLVFELSELDNSSSQANECRWHDMISYSVYSSDGAIMVGSQPIVTCPVCKGKKKESCSRCMFRGVIQSGSPTQVLGAFVNGDLDTFQKVTVDMKESALSLCQNKQKSSWKRCEGTPYFVSEQKDSRTAPRVYPTGNLLDFPGSQTFRKNCEPVSQATVLLLQKLIRDTFKAHHSKLFVLQKGVCYEQSKKRYIVKPVGIGCHYCIKAREEHSDSRIYFIVTANGVQQCCHSNTKGPGNLECKECIPAPIKMNRSMKHCLFPLEMSKVSMSNQIYGSSYHNACLVVEHHKTFLKQSGKKRKKRGDIFGN